MKASTVMDIVSIGVPMVTVVSFAIYTKVQTMNNKEAIDKLEKELHELREKQSERDEKLYARIQSEVRIILDSISSIKSDFRSVETCNQFRAECMRKH